MAKVIKAFQDNIKCGSEYVCTCCYQLWYRSSVRKWEANKYTKCSKTLLKACITTSTSIDNTKWICSTCHSNLSDGKLPDCSEANKMGFLVKPLCLNLTSQTIPMKLKQRLSYKHHYQFQNVRPRKVLEAAKYLVKTSELFQNERIKVQENWLDIILILEVMILLQIKVMNGKNFSLIHSQALIILKYIQIYLKLLFLNLLKDMIIMPNN